MVPLGLKVFLKYRPKENESPESPYIQGFQGYPERFTYANLVFTYTMIQMSLAVTSIAQHCSEMISNAHWMDTRHTDMITDVDVDCRPRPTVG